MRRIGVQTIGILSAAIMLTGCGRSSGLPEAYSFEDRAVYLTSSQENSASVPLFAADLCVVSGETQNDDDSLTAVSGGLFDVSGKNVLYSKNAFERLYPASTTKVMTALIALEEGNLSDQVTVTEDAVITEAGATLAGIKPGDVLSMEQLIYGLMLPSGNDAANAISVHMGGLDVFAEKMNARARELGATQTHFVNSNGLHSEDHYTTAYDLYLIFNEALKIPKFREVIGAPSYTADYVNAAGEAVSKTWNTGNWYQKGETPTPAGLTVMGGKTGTTQAAGNCLIMASNDGGGTEYISVVLKAANRNDLYSNMTQIISKIVN